MDGNGFLTESQGNTSVLVSVDPFLKYMDKVAAVTYQMVPSPSAWL